MSSLRVGLCGVSVSSFLAQEKMEGEVFLFLVLDARGTLQMYVYEDIRKG